MIDKERKENIKVLLEEKYNKTKFEITNLESKKKNLFENYDTSITPSYSSTPSGKGGTSDKVFNAVSKKENELEKIDNLIAVKKSFINQIDSLIETLNYKEQVVVREHAFKHKDFYTISKELKSNYDIDIYNQVYCSRVYRDSINKLNNFVVDNNIVFE